MFHVAAVGVALSNTLKQEVARKTAEISSDRQPMEKPRSDGSWTIESNRERWQQSDHNLHRQHHGYVHLTHH